MGKPEDRLGLWDEPDLRWVIASVVRRRSDHEHILELIRDKPDLIEVMLDDPGLLEKLYQEDHVLLPISPALLFSLLLRRAHRDLKDAAFTVEVAQEGRLPVFDARKVADLLDDGEVRSYLADMLASFTRVESVTVFYRGRRGLVRRTYSDLSVDDMIELSGLVDGPDRFPFLKRAGDGCLLLTGMFPDFVRQSRRSLEAYEALGKECYEKASELEEERGGSRGRVLRRLAEAFHLARKPLALIAERYIPRWRQRWFQPGLRPLL